MYVPMIFLLHSWVPMKVPLQRVANLLRSRVGGGNLLPLKMPNYFSYWGVRYMGSILLWDTMVPNIE